MGGLRRRIDGSLRRRLPRRAYFFLRRRLDDARRVVGANPGRGRMLPDFIIVGAAKSGTTTLYGGLVEHPWVEPCTTSDAYFGNTKEVHFFDYNFYRGEDWYRAHFPLRRDRELFAREHGAPFLTGEASPPYLSHLWVPQRVRKMVPDVKLIAVLRDPIERAFSQFQMSRREGVEPLESFEEAIAREDERLRPEIERMAADPRYNSWNFGCWSYLARSRYAEQVERWLAVFPREQFLFLKAEDLFTDPNRVFAATHEFLGLPRQSAEQAPRLNTSASYEGLNRATREQLLEYFRPHNERLYELIGIDFGWERETREALV